MGPLRVVIASQVLVTDKDVWYCSLACLLIEDLLHNLSVFNLIHLDYLYVNPGDGTKEILGLCAVWAVRLGPDDDLVFAVGLFDNGSDLLGRTHGVWLCVGCWVTSYRAVFVICERDDRFSSFPRIRAP